VLGVALEGDAANVQVLQVREGVMVDRQSFFLEAAGADDEATVLEQFALEYYALALAIPPLVIVPRGAAVGDALRDLLSSRRGSRVEVRAPERGDKRRLSELAQRNARFALDQDVRRAERVRSRRREALHELQVALGLEAPPLRIECYDISNLGETYAVASMAVFEQGQAARSQYRTFTMRHPEADDFARIEEAVRRRFTHEGDDASFAARPGLVVIDGGRGQLGAALRAMADSGAEGIPVVALAKREEEVYQPGRSEPVPLPGDSAGLRLLQQVRDEAHRFALRHHRQRRGQGMTTSLFDALPGVGPVRRRAILRHFGSPDRFLEASREELAAVPGLPPKVAARIWDHLHKTAGPTADRDQARTMAWSGG
jgi:excinuclease ABC subunit C